MSAWEGQEEMLKVAQGTTPTTCPCPLSLAIPTLADLEGEEGGAWLVLSTGSDGQCRAQESPLFPGSWRKEPNHTGLPEPHWDLAFLGHWIELFSCPWRGQLMLRDRRLAHD